MSKRMTSRQRMLTALRNETPDRLPCQVHVFMDYYLKTYLGGISGEEAFEKFGMDLVCFLSCWGSIAPQDAAKWLVREVDLGRDKDGNQLTRKVITTPKGDLSYTLATNVFTSWMVEPIAKDKKDMELVLDYLPVPKYDDAPVRLNRERIGERGIVRGLVWPFDACSQPGVWQDFTMMVGVQNAIMAAMTEADWVHDCLARIAQKKMRWAEQLEGSHFDLIENGGGAASSTVISPSMFEEFVMPYDRPINELLHSSGMLVVYHTCGGMMSILDQITRLGVDVSETLTPPGMGGDARPSEIKQRIGDKVALIGGFDQQAGFERGNLDLVRKMVFELFEQLGPRGGYVLSPSDQFFFGDPRNVQAFADAAKECVY